MYTCTGILKIILTMFAIDLGDQISTIDLKKFDKKFCIIDFSIFCRKKCFC